MTASLHMDQTILRNVRYATTAQTSACGDLRMFGGKIQTACSASSSLRAAHDIDLSGFFVLPGLINAHDHLQYALHPKLGQPPYKNYIEWGDDIHANQASIIQQYKSIPRSVRLWWGGLRNLLSGVTTVCHHDALYPELLSADFPVRVLQEFGWAHSVALDPDFRSKWAATPAGAPFFVHACEGTDELARLELDELNELGVLDQRAVLVHGLALDRSGFELLQHRHASLVLCLSSNQFLYGDLPDQTLLDSMENIALGSDSPLTAAGDLLDEIRFAIEHIGVSTVSAYRMTTDLPARILRLQDGEGCIRDTARADIFAIRDNGEPAHVRLSMLTWRDVEFVMVGGEIRLASEDVWQRLSPFIRRGMELIWIDDEVRWLRAPVGELLRQAEAVLGSGSVRLNGRAVRPFTSAMLRSHSQFSKATFGAGL
jgi:cytosine/adenosine deaminase-related metal-dependent hydrolase